MKFSADQHLAIAQQLRRVSLWLEAADPRRSELGGRARWFIRQGKVARDEDWPSCSVGAACALTEDEAKLFVGADMETWRRVYCPYLTDSEKQSLRQEAKEASAYYRNAFAHLRLTSI